MVCVFVPRNTRLALYSLYVYVLYFDVVLHQPKWTKIVVLLLCSYDVVCAYFEKSSDVLCFDFAVSRTKVTMLYVDWTFYMSSYVYTKSFVFLPFYYNYYYVKKLQWCWELFVWLCMYDSKPLIWKYMSLLYELLMAAAFAVISQCYCVACGVSFTPFGQPTLSFTNWYVKLLVRVD